VKRFVFAFSLPLLMGLLAFGNSVTFELEGLERLCFLAEASYSFSLGDFSFNYSGGIGKGYGIVHPYIVEPLRNFVEFYYFSKASLGVKMGPVEMEGGILHEERGPGIDKLFLDDNPRFYGFPGLSLRASAGKVRFETLWLNLSVPGRAFTKGFNYRTLVLEFGNLSVAYEDSVVYTDKPFDPYYFFVPLPPLAIQEFWYQSSPWQSRIDHNALMGGWAEYRFESGRIYAEFLIDDLSLNRLLGRGGYLNPDKVAFLFGGEYEGSSWKLYAEVSGASAYTFQRTHPDVPYEYTYFDEGPIEERMIGYKYGENSLSFKVGVETELMGLNLRLSYHYLIHGDRTPEVPWHGGDMPPDTKWLVGNVEQGHGFRVDVSKSLKGWRVGGFFEANSRTGMTVGVVMSLALP